MSTSRSYEAKAHDALGLLPPDHPLSKAVDALTLASQAMLDASFAICLEKHVGSDWDLIRLHIYAASKHYAVAVALLLENTVPGIEDVMLTPPAGQDEENNVPIVAHVDGTVKWGAS